MPFHMYYKWRHKGSISAYAHKYKLTLQMHTVHAVLFYIGIPLFLAAQQENHMESEGAYHAAEGVTDM